MEDQIKEALLLSVNSILTCYGFTPETPVNSLTKHTVENLAGSMANILETAIRYSKEV